MVILACINLKKTFICRETYMSDFVHLHCHTEYSLLDGAIRVKDLCARAKDFGMSSVAITDHGNLFGAVHFYTEAKAFGLKPIIGCEVYVAHKDRFDRESQHARTRYHLVLLAQNLDGYRNLVKLVSLGFLEGMYYKPRVDKELLAKYSGGLIALSACMAGEVPRLLMSDQADGFLVEDNDGGMGEGGRAAALAAAEEYSRIFPGRFYLELQDNGIAKQAVLNDRLIELAKASGLPLVATNDCHYLSADDVDAHDILLCIQTRSTITDPGRMRFATRELYYKSPEEMYAAFGHVPEALENTLAIAEACDLKLDLKSYHFPAYDLLQGVTPDDEFRRLSREGLAARLDKIRGQYPIDEAAYAARLEEEMDVICKMGFAGYFLIVQDFINWAKNNGIPVGPGRGSAAGALVAWALRITNLDPIPYQLLFERFLNPERVSMPDIDVDFCERRRGEVIRYVSEKYGYDSVAQITTFGKMKARAVVRDVARALDISLAEADRIAKLVPEDLGMTIEKALKQEPDLAALYRSDDSVTRLLDTSLRLEGLNRHASTHAAGVVISQGALTNYVPIYRGQKDELVTQFDMKRVEKVGLIKFDFLGLRTMTLIADTLELIKAGGKTPPDLDSLPLNDAATYALYSRGDTDGIFQVESSGMRRYLTMLRPTEFNDIIAMLALYRPGPLNSGMVDEFIKRKHGEVEVSYPHASLEECLKSTHGVIVYQEQVMQIAQIVAGYTLGQADMLRRAMGKKDVEIMAAQRADFVTGAAKNNISENQAHKIFDLMEKFAEYGFNKSHSAAYALISYHTAYLKTHYPVEFMAALLTSEMGNQDKLLKYVAACKDMGIPVLQPSVKLSTWHFSVHEGSVVFGLGGIKNVGEDAVRDLVEAREAGEEFISLLDLCSRINLRKMNKRAMESLIKGGACDCFGVSRSRLLAGLEPAMQRGQKRQKDRESGQTSLFNLMPQAPAATQPGLGFDYPEGTEELSHEAMLAFEKEALGFFLTSHPLQPYRREFPRLGLTTLEDCLEFLPGEAVRVGVLVTHTKEHINKRGDKMAFCQIEDLTGAGECVFFADEYAKYKELLHTDQPLELEVKLSRRQDSYTPPPANSNGDSAASDAADSGHFTAPGDDESDEAPRQLVKLVATSARALRDACESSQSAVDIDLPENCFTAERLTDLEAILKRYPGEAPVILHFSEGHLEYHLDLPRHKIAWTHDLAKELDAWCAGE